MIEHVYIVVSYFRDPEETGFNLYEDDPLYPGLWVVAKPVTTRTPLQKKHLLLVNNRDELDIVLGSTSKGVSFVSGQRNRRFPGFLTEVTNRGTSHSLLVA